MYRASARADTEPSLTHTDNPNNGNFAAYLQHTRASSNTDLGREQERPPAHIWGRMQDQRIYATLDLLRNGVANMNNCISTSASLSNWLGRWLRPTMF
jgi:hypothetical protein